MAANIAEGHGRDGRGEFVQFLRVAQGSLKELETHLLVSQRVELAPAKTVDPILGRCEAIGKMLRALIRSLQKKGVASRESGVGSEERIANRESRVGSQRDFQGENNGSYYR